VSSASHPRPSLALIIAALLSVYVIWGTTYFAIKVVVLGGMPSFFFMGVRFGTAGGLMLLWQLARRAPMPSARQWLNAMLIGGLLLVIGNGGVTLAEHRVSSGATVALLSVVPLLTAGVSGLLGEWPRPLEWVAMALGTSGIALMLLGHDLTSDPFGTALLLAAGLSWAVGTVLSRRLDIPGGATGFGAEMLCAGALSLLISLAIHEPWRVPPSGPVWLGLGYLVFFGSIIGFSAYRFLVERVAATLAMTYAYVNPPVALLTGWWLGNERFSTPLLAGLPIVLAAVALQTWAHARNKAS